jgi:hypothetical protein
MPCLKCGEKEGRPKFCSRSCAASRNNLGVTRNGGPSPNCVQCGKKTGKNARNYCSRVCYSAHDIDVKWAEFMAGRFDGHAQTLRVLVLRLRGRVCGVCGLTEWLGQPIPLDVDHTDGNPDNNSPENLRMLCKNCHALTPTYGARNRGNGRSYRREFYDRHGYS